MNIFAIDPGNTYSALAVIDRDTLRPLETCILENSVMLWKLAQTPLQASDRAVIEKVASYGMAVGETVFETVFWTGRFYEVLSRRLTLPPDRLPRMEEKMHICHDSRAKDTNIRRALIDRFAEHDFRSGRGTVKNPDFFFGFKKDIWAAYAVGLTYIETRLDAGA